jgi:ribosomal protein S18
MVTNYFQKKQKPFPGLIKKKRINWSQSLKVSSTKSSKNKKMKKSLQYIMLLKKFSNTIEYTNLKLLKAFLTKYGKIKARKKTRVNVQQQRKLSRSIRKARAFGLIPFICNVQV